jgi:hypothetical protein
VLFEGEAVTVSPGLVKVIELAVMGYVAVADPLTVSVTLPVAPVFVLQVRVPDPRVRPSLFAHVVPVPMASANTPKRIRCRTISL